MKKIIRLTENDLTKLVKKVINEQAFVAGEYVPVQTNQLPPYTKQFITKYGLDKIGTIKKDVELGFIYFFPSDQPERVNPNMYYETKIQIPSENQLEIYLKDYLRAEEDKVAAESEMEEYIKNYHDTYWDIDKIRQYVKK